MRDAGMCDVRIKGSQTIFFASPVPLINFMLVPDPLRFNFSQRYTLKYGLFRSLLHIHVPYYCVTNPATHVGLISAEQQLAWYLSLLELKSGEMGRLEPQGSRLQISNRPPGHVAPS